MLSFFHCRSDMHKEFVLALKGDGENVFYQHIVGGTDAFAIQIDVRAAVQSFKEEHGFSAFRRNRLKTSVIPDMGLFETWQFSDVHAKKRLFDQTVGL